ncbi:hypothetical protein [Halobaculum sp. EA56]|uniref:hypothetical protein n=1 Tax=Halobaculum sp. EA56 TaxID=3421648 RepID=UPI003EC0BD0D
MTRSTVTVSGHELLDVFHDHERTYPVVVEVGSSDHGEICVPEASPSDITIRGYQDTVDENEYGGTWELRHNGERIAEGYLNTRLSSAVTAEIGASLIEVPPAQRVVIDVYGERVNGGDA